jgi:C4-dicarboxylate-specific signal transduction histidine kinase
MTVAVDALLRLDPTKSPIAVIRDDTAATLAAVACGSEKRPPGTGPSRLTQDSVRPEGRISLEQMLIALSHELNQPLAATLHYAASAKRALRAGPEFHADCIAAIEKICGQAERTHRIIRDLRSLLDKRGMEISDFDINASVCNVLEWADASIGGYAIKVDLDLARDLPMVRAGRTAAEQILLNIVINAAEALQCVPGDKRRIGIWTARTASRGIELGISDTGPGIPAELRSRIFEPFVSTKRNGMGLGLAICRILADQFGGAVSSRFDAGCGAMFVVDLPTAGSAQESCDD